MEEFLSGCRRSLPIALGYFPVSFSFGVFVASSGLPLGLATLISITNLTSSGQFAGVSLMLVQASYMETALTLLMINARYFLMSLSLSQKIDQKMSTLERMVISFGITDETFSLASLEQKTLSFPYMAGFILIPIIGWTSGTLAGETLTNLLPASLQNAMGLALYGMFLAIIIPASSKSRAFGEVVLLAAILSTLMYVTPLFQELSSGFQLIIATLLAALYGAWRYPIEEKE
ncbi:AzlC family ABC transporter permease [Massilimicrobiota timonensis]|uniref:Branched-chain amino acid ABC transporter permease n=1 Tax=Massilimicrobiota timonensis TaxID=1776392 RepID=A0A1Y4SW33_9FIRM|nr:AzlC family ABC transporter permease [Massilimicrobiota timonensis]OUQ34127.1 branched-chain amino acid ABC transporter permease [Massilimicrobiota timonensis]